jgi:hypothetical protein
MSRSTSLRKWEKKWDTSGAYPKFAWFPSTLVQTRKFVPLGEIDASVQATMSGALLMRTRSALSQAERRAVELSLVEEKKKQQQQQQQQQQQHVVTGDAVDDNDDDDAPTNSNKAKRARTGTQ